MILKVEISAETQDQADAISKVLLDKRLVTGGQFINTPSRFLWKGEVVDMDYCTMTSFTVPEHKEAIITEVEAVSEEEVPMIAFIDFEPNRKLLDWVRATVGAE